MSVLFLLLTEIHVDYAWNCRRESDVRANESNAVQDEQSISQGEGLRGLKQTLSLRGQDTPVVVRKVERNRTLGGHYTDKPYELVAGFRRYTAVSELPAVPGVPIGAIRAEVRELDPPSAVLLNARENTDRQNLSLPDLLRACARLSALGLTQEQIGHELSVTPYHVARLLRVAKLPDSVLRHWRGETKLPGRENQVAPHLTLNEMTQLQVQAEREQLLPHQVFERYVLALSPHRRKSPPKRNATLYIRRVHEAAALAGALVRAGVLEEGNLDWSLVIGFGHDGYPIDIGNNAHEEATREKFYEVARLAFVGGKEPPAL